MPPVINREKCIGCMTCASICQQDVFGLQKKGAKYPVIQFPRECKNCNSCVLDCPTGACTLRFAVPQMMVFYESPAPQKEYQRRSIDYSMITDKTAAPKE